MIETIHEKFQEKRSKPEIRPTKTDHQSKVTTHQPIAHSAVTKNVWTEAFSGKGLTPGSYWYNKRKEVLSRDGYTCTRCGVTKNLSIDHRTPLSLGGDDSMDNLTTLCKDCHENKDQRNIFNRDFDADDNYGRNPQLSRKVQIVANALKQNQNVRINYTDSKGKTTEREVQPKQLVKNKGRIYLISYCYLRNEKRTFRLSRARIIG